MGSSRKGKSQKNSKYSAIGVRFSCAPCNGPESACLRTDDLARWLISMFQIEDNKVTDYGPCECCGDLSRLASGLVKLDKESYAAYQVHWTTHQVARHGAESMPGAPFVVFAMISVWSARSLKQKEGPYRNSVDSKKSVNG